MPAYAQTLTYVFSLGILTLHVALGLMVVHRLVRGVWLPESVQVHLAQYGLRYAALFPVASLFLSLWYSDIVGLPVCALCWFGRTMMYPLAIMLPLAAWRNDRRVWQYTLPLAGIGALITGYQHLLQVGFVTGSLCNALHAPGDCAARYVYEFGYITMPLFGVTVFLVTALLVWIAREQ
jgi:disulfide bond formation protein DsbB